MIEGKRPFNLDEAKKVLATFAEARREGARHSFPTIPRPAANRGIAGDLGEQGRFHGQARQVRQRRQGRRGRDQGSRQLQGCKSPRCARIAAVATRPTARRRHNAQSARARRATGALGDRNRPPLSLGCATRRRSPVARAVRLTCMRNAKLGKQVARCCASSMYDGADWCCDASLVIGGCGVLVHHHAGDRVRRARSGPTRPISTTARPCSTPAAARRAMRRPIRRTRPGSAAGSA